MEGNVRRDAYHRPVDTWACPSIRAMLRSRALGSRAREARTSMAMGSVSSSSMPRRMAVRPAAAMSSGRLLAAGHVGGHAGIDAADDEGGDLRPLPGQLGADAGGGGAAGELGGAVAAHGRHGHEAAGGEHIDDGPAAILRQDGGEGAGHAHGAEIVDLHLLAGGVEGLRADEALIEEGAGVVDDDGDIAALRRGGGDLVGLRDVEAERDGAARGLGGQMGGGVRIAGADVDLARRRRPEGRGRRPRRCRDWRP